MLDIMGDNNDVLPDPNNDNAVEAAQDPAVQVPVQGQEEKNKRWKLKNANMRIVDICTQTKPGGREYLVIKMEFQFTNRAKEHTTKVVGRLLFRRLDI